MASTVITVHNTMCFAPHNSRDAKGPANPGGEGQWVGAQLAIFSNAWWSCCTAKFRKIPMPCSSRGQKRLRLLLGGTKQTTICRGYGVHYEYWTVPSINTIQLEQRSNFRRYVRGGPMTFWLDHLHHRLLPKLVRLRSRAFMRCMKWRATYEIFRCLPEPT